jgi:hypothetical protein
LIPDHGDDHMSMLAPVHHLSDVPALPAVAQPSTVELVLLAALDLLPWPIKP